MEKTKTRFFTNYRFYICILITLLVFVLSLNFLDSFYRIYVAVKDFLFSIAYYFLKLFYVDTDFSVTVTDLVTYPGTTSDVVTTPEVIPVSYDIFSVKMSMYFHSFFNIQTLAKYLVSLINQFAIFVRWFLILLPLVLVVYLLHRKLFSTNDKEAASDSKNLVKWKSFEAKVLDPIYNWISNLIYYISSHKFFLIIWICIFCVYFNLFSVVLDILAYYFYFIVSFDLKNIYLQFYKLFIDLKPMLEFIPGIVWLIIFLIIFDKMRKARAYNVLDHHELMNRGFVNSCGQATFIIGTPGTGKTTALTDMGLSQEVMYRDKALELLLKAQVEFPNFPWIKLEKVLRFNYRKEKIFNLASSASFARKVTAAFISSYKENDLNTCKNILFNYDFKTYGLEFDDGSKIIDFLSDVDSEHSVLEIYCKLYFIYICQSSLIISNYGIRSNYSFSDKGNLPLWNYEFFRTPSAYSDDSKSSTVSHILDWDCLRIGKKMIENNKKANAFEFGIVVITEIGKERGNQYDTKGMKKDDDRTNQVNDQFNNFLKLVRHSATVDNFPFIKVLFDDQRAESLGADGRELCEKVIHIKEKSDAKNPLWMFRLESIFFDFISSKYNSFHTRYRYWRSDNIIYSYFIDAIYSKIYSYYIKLFNTFSFAVQNIDLESSKMDGNFEQAKYYLSYKKIYSYRFATDAFSDYFYRKAESSNVGINSLPSFKAYRASLEELSSENSYLFNSLLDPVLASSKQNSETGEERRASRSPFPAEELDPKQHKKTSGSRSLDSSRYNSG